MEALIDHGEGLLVPERMIVAPAVGTFRAVDVTAADVSVVEAFAAWTLVRLLGSVPVTPGGLGVVEDDRRRLAARHRRARSIRPAGAPPRCRPA